MEEPLRIAICEDTQSDEDRLLELLKQCSIPNEPTVFHCAEALLEVYTPQKFDLLMTDIFMGGMSGVEMVSRLRERGQDIPVAFVTTSTDFALEGYRLSAMKYIEKPFTQKDVEETLLVAQMRKNCAPMLTIQRGGREECLRFARIVYLEQKTHHVMIHLRDGEEIEIYDKLADLLPQLEGQGFFQPHKSYSVNLDAVRCIDGELRSFVMQNGANVPIRRESMGKARKALQAHLFDLANSQNADY